MLFKPKWLKRVQEGCKPSSESTISELEELRKQFDIPHDMFAMRITSSIESIRPLQYHLLKRLKRQNPEAPEKELWKEILESRMDILDGLGDAVPDSEQISDIINSADSFDDICDFIVSFYSEDDEAPDPLGIGKRIDDILKHH